MPRIRTIKPEIIQSARLGECSRDARLLFVYLITQADCYGNQRGDARLIRGAMFPYDDDITAGSVNEWIEELDARQLIRLYEVDGQRYVNFPSWLDHQVINKPGKPLVPAPDGVNPANPPESPGTPRNPPADLDLDLDLDPFPTKSRVGVKALPVDNFRGGI